MILFFIIRQLIHYETLLKSKLLNSSFSKSIVIIDDALYLYIIYYNYLIYKYVLINKNFSKINKLIIIILSLFITIFPLADYFNKILSLFCKNGPYIKNIDHHFSGNKNFINNYKIIKKEVEILLQTKQKCFSDILSNVSSLQNETKDKCWKWLTIFDGAGYNKEAILKLPKTVELIKKYPEIASASISIIEPGTELLPHRGYWKGFLRYHLGLIIPTDDPAYIIVDKEKYYWKEGESVMFDDMYIHSVKNPSKYRRVVLFIDIYRKNIPYVLDKTNKFLVGLLSNTIKKIENNTHNTTKKSN